MSKRRPNAEERDERVKVDLDPEEFIRGTLAVKPLEHGGESDKRGETDHHHGDQPGQRPG